MAHWIEPLLIAVETPPEASLEEVIETTELHRRLQEATVHWLRFGEGGSVVEAILAILGVDPFAYWEELCDGIDRMVGDAVEVDGLQQLDGYTLDYNPQPALILPY